MNINSLTSWEGLMEMYDDCVEILEIEESQSKPGQFPSISSPSHNTSKSQNNAIPTGCIKPNMMHKDCPRHEEEDGKGYFNKSQDDQRFPPREEVPRWVGFEGWEEFLTSSMGGGQDNGSQMASLKDLMAFDATSYDERRSSTSTSDDCMMLEDAEDEHLATKVHGVEARDRENANISK